MSERARILAMEERARTISAQKLAAEREHQLRSTERQRELERKILKEEVAKAMKLERAREVAFEQARIDRVRLETEMREASSREKETENKFSLDVGGKQNSESDLPRNEEVKSERGSSKIPVEVDQETTEKTWVSQKYTTAVLSEAEYPDRDEMDTRPEEVHFEMKIKETKNRDRETEKMMSHDVNEQQKLGSARSMEVTSENDDIDTSMDANQASIEDATMISEAENPDRDEINNFTRPEDVLPYFHFNESDAASSVSDSSESDNSESNSSESNSSESDTSYSDSSSTDSSDTESCDTESSDESSSESGSERLKCARVKLNELREPLLREVSKETIHDGPSHSTVFCGRVKPSTSLQQDSGNDRSKGESHICNHTAQLEESISESDEYLTAQLEEYVTESDEPRENGESPESEGSHQSKESDHDDHQTTGPQAPHGISSNRSSIQHGIATTGPTGTRSNSKTRVHNQSMSDKEQTGVERPASLGKHSRSTSESGSENNEYTTNASAPEAKACTQEPTHLSSPVPEPCVENSSTCETDQDTISSARIPLVYDPAEVEDPISENDQDHSLTSARLSLVNDPSEVQDPISGSPVR